MSNWNLGLGVCLAVLLSVGCGGSGSSTDEPAAAPVEVSFSESSTSVAEGAGDFLVNVVLATPEALQGEVSVELVDVGLGSATSGADYAEFGTSSVTFPAGSTTGATRSVTVTTFADSLAEGAETVQIELDNPTGGAALGGVTRLEVMIVEDLTGVPARLEVAGSAGALLPGASLDFGDASVGSSVQETLVFRNQGGESFTLASPILTTGDLSEFAVQVAVGDTLATPGPSSTLLSPLAPLSEGVGTGLSVALDPNLFQSLAGRKNVVLEDFALPGSEPVDLKLVALPTPWSNDAVVVVDGVARDPKELTGDVQLFRGQVVGQPESSVFLSLASTGSRGWIRLADEASSTVHLVPEVGSESHYASPARLMWTPQLEQVIGQMGHDTARGCAGALNPVPGGVLRSTPTTGELPAPSGLTLAGARLAIETDYQFFQRFEDAEAATTYVTQLMAALGDQYFTDVQCTLEIAYLGIYTDPDDPWDTPEADGGNTAAMLEEFRAAWGSSWPVEADLAHFLSGANLGGGIAYVNVLCDRNFGFGVSASINGFIDFNNFNQSPSPLNWDFVVIGHELGHNFGADHTHEYCPPLDQCFASCSGGVECGRGTIMSYCHTCAGGVGNIDLNFHPSIANIVRTTINQSCLGDAQLDSGDAISVQVRFEPQAEGEKTTQLLVPTNAPNVTGPGYTLTLQGEGTP